MQTAQLSQKQFSSWQKQPKYQTLKDQINQNINPASSSRFGPRQRSLSPQVRIFNRNVYLRQAYKKLIQDDYQKQLKSMSNMQKLHQNSYLILKQKLHKRIQTITSQICSQNQSSHQQQLTFQQMTQAIFTLNHYLKAAQKSVQVQQLLSQIWLYLKNYDIDNQYLDSNMLIVFMKLIMDPKSIKPVVMKQIMSQLDEFSKSSQSLIHFIKQYPELQQEALQDVEIFNLWYRIKQKHNMFTKHYQQKMQQGSRNRSRYQQQDQCTFKPQISQNSRMYAQKSLQKYLSKNKLNHQKRIIREKSPARQRSTQEENQLQQYLSHKVGGTATDNYRQSLTSRELNNNYNNQNDQYSSTSYHQLLYKRKLQKQSISRRLNFQNEQLQRMTDNSRRKATPAQVKQIVQKMYFIPQKRQDINYNQIKQQRQLKQCTFAPQTIDYDYSKKVNAQVNGFEKQVNRLKKGRQQKQKLKQIYQNLGKPKNTNTTTKQLIKSPSFLQRSAPKLILQVNIGSGRIQKIKLIGNQDPKLVAKRFITKHGLDKAMQSVLEQLVEQNLRGVCE